MVDDVRELAGILRRAGLDDDRLRLVIEDGATHDEVGVGAAVSRGAGIFIREAVIESARRLRDFYEPMLRQEATPAARDLQTRTAAAIAITES